MAAFHHHFLFALTQKPWSPWWDSLSSRWLVFVFLVSFLSHCFPSYGPLSTDILYSVLLLISFLHDVLNDDNIACLPREFLCLNKQKAVQHLTVLVVDLNWLYYF